MNGGYYIVSELFGSSYYSDKDKDLTVKRLSIVDSIIIDHPFVLNITTKTKKYTFLTTVSYTMTNETVKRLQFLNMIRFGKCLIDKRIESKINKLIKDYSSKMSSCDTVVLSRILDYPLRAYFSSLAVNNVVVKVE